MLSYSVYFEIKQQNIVSMCIHVEYVCVKFGCKSATGYDHLGKTTQEGHYYGTPCRNQAIIF